MSDCKRYLEEPACLLRQIAEGSTETAGNECQHCDTTLAELELQPELIKQVAGEISTSFAAETGHRKAADLARAGLAFAKSPEDTALLVRCPSCGSQSSIEDNSTLNNFACSTCNASIQIVDRPAGDSSEKRRLGHFELLEQVGSGSFGVVWKAHDTELDRTVAIKIPRREQLSAKDIEDFVHEARASAALNHPHIVSVYEIGRADESVYIVSDFVEGSTLDDYLSDRLLSGKEAATICATIADALDHAHEKGVVHRDLKPANIALNDQLKPTIMDFGLALRGGTEMTMTTDGKILGTPAYMSPEQARGESNRADGRSDIYSLGVILYQMLTGERPFRGNLRMLLDQIMHDEPLNPQRLNSAVPRDLATICLKCLEKSPERRYETARELKSDLDRFLEGRPIAARPVSSVERGWRWCTRNPVPAGLATLFLVTLITGTVVSTWKWRDATVAVARSEKILRIVGDSFDAANPESGATADMSAKDVLLKAKESLGKSDLDDLGTIRLLSELSRSFFGLGETELAIQAAEEQRNLCAAKFGSRHPELLKTMHFLVVLYGEAGRIDEAVQLAENNLNLMKIELGPDHPDTLRAMAELGVTYDKAGRFGEAIALYEESLAKMEPGKQAWLGAMANLALGYRNTGQLDEAIELLEQTIRICETKLGSDHPNTLMTMFNLSMTYNHAKRFDEAIELCKRVNERQNTKLGPDHPDTLMSTSGLASVYHEVGRSEEAIELLEQSVSSHETKLGPGHQQTLLSMANLAASYFNTGRQDKGIELWERTLRIQRTELGRDHPATLMTMHNLGRAYGKAGRYDKAIELREPVVKLRKVKLGLDHPDTLMSMNGLGFYYLRAGRMDEALEFWEESLALLKAEFGPDAPFAEDMMHSLSLTYEEAGRSEDAINLLQSLFKLRRSHLGADHPRTVEALNNLVYKLTLIEPTDHRLDEELMDALRKSPHNEFTLNTLAVAEYRLGDFDKAIAAANASNTKMSGPDFPINYAILAMSHFKLEQPDEANEFREKLAESMKLDEFKTDEDCHTFAGEVDALFEAD